MYVNIFKKIAMMVESYSLEIIENNIYYSVIKEDEVHRLDVTDVIYILTGKKKLTNSEVQNIYRSLPKKIICKSDTNVYFNKKKIYKILYRACKDAKILDPKMYVS